MASVRVASPVRLKPPGFDIQQGADPLAARSSPSLGATPWPLPPTATLPNGPPFTKGERVQVLSKTGFGGWVDGIVQEVAKTAGNYGGCGVPAGAVLVAYSNRAKWVTPDHLAATLRRPPISTQAGAGFGTGTFTSQASTLEPPPRMLGLSEPDLNRSHRILSPTSSPPGGARAMRSESPASLRANTTFAPSVVSSGAPPLLSGSAVVPSSSPASLNVRPGSPALTATPPLIGSCGSAAQMASLVSRQTTDASLHPQQQTVRSGSAMTEFAGPPTSRARIRELPDENRSRLDVPSITVYGPETQVTRQFIEEVIESHRQEDERHFLQLSFQAFENLLAPIRADMLGTLEQALHQRSQTFEVDLQDFRSRLEGVETYVSECFDKAERPQAVSGTSVVTRAVRDRDVAASPCFGRGSEGGGLATVQMQVASLDDSHKAQMEQIEQLISSRFVVAQQIAELAEQMGHHVEQIEQLISSRFAEQTGHHAAQQARLDDMGAEKLNAKVQELTTKVATHEQLARRNSADLQGLSTMIGDQEQKVERALAARPLPTLRTGPDSFSAEDVRDMKLSTLEREVGSLRATAINEVVARSMQTELEKHIIECHRRLDEETARLAKDIEVVRRDAADMLKGIKDTPLSTDRTVPKYPRLSDHADSDLPSGAPPALVRRYASAPGRPPPEEPSNCRQT